MLLHCSIQICILAMCNKIKEHRITRCCQPIVLNDDRNENMFDVFDWMKCCEGKERKGAEGRKRKGKGGRVEGEEERERGRMKEQLTASSDEMQEASYSYSVVSQSLTHSVAALLVHHVLFIVFVTRSISAHHRPYLIDLLRRELISIPQCPLCLYDSR